MSWINGDLDFGCFFLFLSFLFYICFGILFCLIWVIFFLLFGLVKNWTMADLIPPSMIWFVKLQITGKNWWSSFSKCFFFIWADFVNLELNERLDLLFYFIYSMGGAFSSLFKWLTLVSGLNGLFFLDIWSSFHSLMSYFGQFFCGSGTYVHFDYLILGR